MSCWRGDAVVGHVGDNHALLHVRDGDVPRLPCVRVLNLQTEFADIFRFRLSRLVGSLDARVISFGNSPVVTGILIVWPLRQTVSSTFCPTFFFRISCCSCESVVDWRSIDLRDQVERPQIALVRGRIGFNRAHNDSFIKPFEQIANGRVVAQRSRFECRATAARFCDRR